MFLFLISVHLYLGQLQFFPYFSHFSRLLLFIKISFLLLCGKNQTALVYCQRTSPLTVFAKRKTPWCHCRDCMLYSLLFHQICLPGGVRLCSYVCVCRCVNIKKKKTLFFMFVSSPRAVVIPTNCRGI